MRTTSVLSEENSSPCSTVKILTGTGWFAATARKVSYPVPSSTQPKLSKVGFFQVCSIWWEKKVYQTFFIYQATLRKPVAARLRPTTPWTTWTTATTCLCRRADQKICGITALSWSCFTTTRYHHFWSRQINCISHHQVFCIYYRPKPRMTCRYAEVTGCTLTWTIRPLMDGCGPLHPSRANTASFQKHTPVRQLWRACSWSALFLRRGFFMLPDFWAAHQMLWCAS